MCVSLLTSVSGAGIWQEEGKPPVTLKAGNNLLVPAGTEGSKIYADTRPLCAESDGAASKCDPPLCAKLGHSNQGEPKAPGGAVEGVRAQAARRRTASIAPSL